MTKIFKTTIVAGFLGLAALAAPTSDANAFFGWNDGNSNGWGNGNGSGNMGFSMNFSGNANARGNGHNGWNGYNGYNGYTPYGYQAPVYYGPTTAPAAPVANGSAPYPVAPFNPYARPQGPVAPQANVQVQPQQPTK